MRPSLVTDDMHAWVGTEAVRAQNVPVSKYPLTDDERQLRDLAYPLIEPPYDRNRWYSVLNEYGLTRIFQRDRFVYDVAIYSKRLMSKPYRSATARYVQLNDDIRNDVVRIEPFFGLARRVIDIDRKRDKSLAFIPDLSESERIDASARIAENALIAGWVQQTLADRASSYRYALERLVAATPTPMAVETERSLQLLQAKIAENKVVAPLQREGPAEVSMGREDRPATASKQAASR